MSFIGVSYFDISQSGTNKKVLTSSKMYGAKLQVNLFWLSCFNKLMNLSKQIKHYSVLQRLLI